MKRNKHKKALQEYQMLLHALQRTSFTELADLFIEANTGSEIYKVLPARITSAIEEVDYFMGQFNSEKIIKNAMRNTKS